MVKIHNQRGDTIVEVLISAAALSLILTLSYGLANRSSQAVRQSQERGEVLKLTESSVERLKQYVSTPGKVVPATGSKFCMKNDGSGDLMVFTGAQNPPSNPQSDNFTQYPSECRANTFYWSFVERNGDTYTTHTRWISVTGNGVDEATMVYRVYPDNQAISGGGTITASCAANQFRNGSGTCTPCQPSFPINYISPGGNVLWCDPILPKINVIARMVSPSSAGVQPSCSSAADTDRVGASISLTGGAPTSPQTTSGTPAATTFAGLAFGTTYTNGLTVPSDTNPDGTASFTACPPASVSTTTPPIPNPPVPHSPGAGGVGAGSVQTVNFKFIPNCYSVTDYGWVDHGYDVDDNEDRHNDPYTEWWQHTGPGWGPNGPYSPTSGPTNTRYGIGPNKDGTYPTEYSQWENPSTYGFGHSTYGSTSVYVRYSEYQDATHGPGVSDWYNRFEKWWAYSAHNPEWRHVYDYQWEATGSHIDCPS